MVKNISLTLLITLTIVVALVASLFATSLTGFAVSGNEEDDTLRVDCSDKSFKLDSSRHPDKKIAIDNVGYVFTLVSATDSSATIKVSDGTTSEQKEITEKSKKEILGIEIRVLSADESTALNKINAQLKITKCKKPSDSGTGGGSGGGSGEVSYQGVLDVLSKCEAFEMGRADPQIHLGKDSATGREMCDWKGKETGKSLTCISSGRIYTDPSEGSIQQGYGIWSCDREAVSSTHNGWALCCSP
mgnify:FL=1